MKIEASSSFAGSIYAIVIILAVSFSFAVKAQAPDKGNTPAELNPQIVEPDPEPQFEDAIIEYVGELNRQIEKLYREGKFKEAIPLAEKVTALTRRAKGDGDIDTATSLNNLAALYYAIGDYAKAEPLFKEALEIHQKVFGQEHPETAQSLNNLAELYRAMGDYAKAEPLFKEALEIYQKILGREHADTALSEPPPIWRTRNLKVK